MPAADLWAPVRVIRGSRHDSPYSPGTGYSYDGLYSVEDYWHAVGKSGFLVWRYRLSRLPDQEHGTDESDKEQSPGVETTGTAPAPPRREGRVLRIVRDTGQARRLKELYDYECQMCGTRLEGLAGPYAEAAHIRPLGAPHHGPDTPDNILCLCPNHHVLFDHGGVTIGEDLSLTVRRGGFMSTLTSPQRGAYLRYRREHYGASD